MKTATDKLVNLLIKTRNRLIEKYPARHYAHVQVWAKFWNLVRCVEEIERININWDKEIK